MKNILWLLAILTVIAFGVLCGTTRRDTTEAVSARPSAAPATKPVKSIAESVTTVNHAPSTTASDPVARYLVMRDDDNPIPRLAFIEETTRTNRADEAADLLAYAMVDPDERVRSRAQALVDRADAILAKNKRSPGQGRNQ